MRKGIIGSLSVVVLGIVGADPVLAQAVVKDPAAIGVCLCEQQRLKTLLDALTERQQNYETSQKALASLNGELETRRAQMNVYNDAEVEAYKQLLTRRDQAAAALAGEATQSYNAAVTRYNQSFVDYNAGCAGKSFDQAVVNTVQATLSCPKP